MTRYLGSTTLAALMLVPAYVLAATPMDADGDGVVSMQEFQTAMPEASPALFDDLDANGDGMLDEAEVSDAQEAGILPG